MKDEIMCLVMKKTVLTITCLFLLVFLSSCAGPTEYIRTEDKVILGGITPVIQDDNGCAPAVLEMMMRYQGVDIDKRAIGRAVGQGAAVGTYLSRVPRLLKKYGLTYSVVKFDDIKTTLVEDELPVGVALPGVAFGHAILIVGYNQRGYYIIDPALGGVREMNYYKFEEAVRYRKEFYVVKKIKQ